jgi:hypothetical protein
MQEIFFVLGNQTSHFLLPGSEKHHREQPITPLPTPNMALSLMRFVQGHGNKESEVYATLEKK